MAITWRPVESDAEYEAWRQVRMAVLPGERCDWAEDLRRAATADRLMVLAWRDGLLAGSGLASPSDTAGGSAARCWPTSPRGPRWT